MSDKPQPTEWFRAGAGIVIVNEQGQVMAFERQDIPGAWQYPQGGIDEGEAPLTTAYRELEEETGIRKEQVELITPSHQLLAYELPESLRKPWTGRGQVQYWFLFRLIISAKQIDLTDKEELKAWKWVDPAELAETVVAFRRDVYRSLAKFVSAHLPKD